MYLITLFVSYYQDAYSGLLILYSCMPHNIIAWKTVSHVINSRALVGEKPCINKAIHVLLMHGYATFNMIVSGPQICCRYEMCTARP